MSGGPFLYPNVTAIPGSSPQVGGDLQGTRRLPGAPTEFDKELDRAISDRGSVKDGIPGAVKGGRSLEEVRQPLKFSAHASQRLTDRKITLSPTTLQKVSDAVEKAEAKGIEDTLVLTPEAALIVNVKNRTVITAMDKNSLNGNVFTNIDGAVII